MIKFGVIIKEKKVFISQKGSRVIDGLDFTNEPILRYLENRWGLKNIYIEGSNKSINHVEYNKIKNYEQSN